MKLKIRVAKALVLSAAIFLAGSSSLLAKDTPSIVEHIRFCLWAGLDAYPGSAEAANLDEGPYDYPIKSMKKVAPFLIQGMVYGWEFSYTPSDKSRGVEEYFELTPIQPLSSSDKITYSSPWLEESRLNAWVDFTRTENQIQKYNLWASISNKSISGTGYGNFSDGFEGIQAAAADCAKNAVREHYRKVIKNKPKEITGRLLIREPPLLGVDSGKYMIKLDFFMESGRIIEYTRF